MICLFIHQAYKKVLVRTQHMSDAIKGMTSKFMHVFEGPYIITRLLDRSAYELRDESGKLRESSTMSNCDSIRKLIMKRKYKNEIKMSQ
jgi:hypothetical protein